MYISYTVIKISNGLVAPLNSGYCVSGSEANGTDLLVEGIETNS